MKDSPRTSSSAAALATAFLLGLAALSPSGLSAQPAAAGPDLHLPAGADKAAEAIDRATIDAGIKTLADDRMEGRGPASKGDELARAYLQDELQKMGYQPGAPGGAWQQPVEFVSVLSKLPKAWSFQAGEKSVDLSFSDEYIGSSLAQVSSSAIEDAELVFVGYGIQAPEYRWDDYKGANLKGKVLVMLNNDPDWDPSLFAGNRRLYYGRWTYKYESGAAQGAAAVIIVHTTPSAGYPWQVVQTSWSGKQFHLPADPAQPALQLAAWATEGAVRKLLAAGGQNLDQLIAASKHIDFRPIPLGIKTTLRFENEVARVRSANVLGRLEGSDPKLKEEVVFYSAHHDHLGVGEPNAAGDKIYNGAVDNASGCAMVLAIAKAYTALPQRPKRSIVVAFVAGEEQGLLGSAYLAANPPVAPGKIAANVNFDSGNIFGKTSDVSFIGYGKSSLDAVVDALAARQGRKVLGDQFPDKGSFYRSDQFNFAKIGVPAIYLGGGTSFVGKPEGWGKQQKEAWTLQHYHQASDNYDPSWNLEGMIDDARLGFLAGLSIAQNPALPAWNAGDEFEAARKKALGTTP